MKCQGETYYEFNGVEHDSILLNQWIPSTLVTHKFKIEDRRRKVATLLALSKTEVEIANELKVGQSTISRDVKVLKELSQRFVFDLAKSDLAYYYKQCIDEIEEVGRRDGRYSKDKTTITV